MNSITDLKHFIEAAEQQDLISVLIESVFDLLNERAIVFKNSVDLDIVVDIGVSRQINEDHERDRIQNSKYRHNDRYDHKYVFQCCIFASKDNVIPFLDRGALRHIDGLYVQRDIERNYVIVVCFVVKLFAVSDNSDVHTQKQIACGRIEIVKFNELLGKLVIRRIIHFNVAVCAVYCNRVACLGYTLFGLQQVDALIQETALAVHYLKHGINAVGVLKENILCIHLNVVPKVNDNFIYQRSYVSLVGLIVIILVKFIFFEQNLIINFAVFDVLDIIGFIKIVKQ